MIRVARSFALGGLVKGSEAFGESGACDCWWAREGDTGMLGRRVRDVCLDVQMIVLVAGCQSLYTMRSCRDVGGFSFWVFGPGEGSCLLNRHHSIRWPPAVMSNVHAVVGSVVVTAGVLEGN